MNEWDDFTNGFRFRNKNLFAEDDEVKSSKEDLLNSRNPSKGKPYLKTMRPNKRTGFGSSASRIDLPTKRMSKKLESPKKGASTNTSEGNKNRRVMYTKPQRHAGSDMMSSVLSKYISKSIYVTSERHSQGGTNRMSTKAPTQSRPIQ